MGFYAYGFHHTLAVILPVAWVIVYMSTPQAAGAMVGVTVACYLRAAVFAHEIFGCSFKFGAH